MGIIIFNWPGVAMVAAAFAAAFGFGSLIGTSAEGPLMSIAGPLCVAFDGVYRFKVSAGRWLHPDGGGAIFFIPVWMLGLLWFGLGITYTMQGRS